MAEEQRLVYFDPELALEAYRLRGVVQPFPNHFHEYYVLGLIESGRRRLWCGGREYTAEAGSLILFNPRDSHRCAPVGSEPLDYRAVNLASGVMRRAVRAVTGREEVPYFTPCTVPRCSAAQAFRALYGAVAGRAPLPTRRQAFYQLLGQLLEDCAPPAGRNALPAQSGEVCALCAYMEQHYSENITLDELAARVRFGKSYLLRVFAREVGVSPYRYLQAVRLGHAKQLLGQGVPPADAAGLAGFSDQSHFTRYFKEFTGLTPGQYQRIFSAQGKKERGAEQWKTKSACL